MIRVIVVDDHPIVCAGLARLIGSEDDIDVVGTALDGATGIELHMELQPDLMLTDLSMQPIDGVETTRRLLARRPDARILVLAATADPPHVLAAIDAGAMGFLLKDSEPESIVQGIRAAVRGESPLDPRLAATLVRDRHSRRVGVKLTDRETEVLRLVMQGMLNKQIGRTLGIGEKTVKAHLGRVYERLGVTNRADAVAWALEADLFGNDSDPAAAIGGTEQS
ncbi:MAG: response regulator [Actinomycetota bacterium]